MAQSAPDHPFVHMLQTRFGGVLYAGKHHPDSKACVLEVASIVRGHAWSDDPVAAILPDLRPLNDARWSSDQVRTETLIPVVIALWDWSTWTRKQQQQWAAKIAERTIREILPPMLRQVGLSTEADRCEQEGAAKAAEAAAWAAKAAAGAARAAGAAEAAWAAEAAAGVARAAEAARAAKAAAWAAEAAARAAKAAAWAWAAWAWAAWAAEAARAAEAAARAAEAAAAEGEITPDSILQLGCRIWIEEAHAIIQEASA